MGARLKGAVVTGASQGVMPTRQTAETRSAVERIAAFAAAARPERLTPDLRQLFKRNILDSLGCAIAALPGPPFQALREQFEEYRAPGRCTLIAGGKTSADQAAPSTPDWCATSIFSTATCRLAASVTRATISGPSSPRPSK
jgi:MmgE/PrpD N-terminal domain